MQVVPPTNDGDIATITFADAIEFCEEIDDTAPPGHCHAIVVADPQGKVIRKTVLQGVFTIDHAVGWTMGFHDSQTMGAALFISLVDHSIFEPDALDVWEFERLNTMVRLLGMDLLDWIITDGNYIRSLAYTNNPKSAWLTDALEMRSEQLEMPDPGLVWT